MPEIKTTIEFQIWCSECGSGLCGNVSDKGRSGDEFYIEPCQKCLKREYDAGYEKGIGEE